jgi:cytochrome b561
VATLRNGRHGYGLVTKSLHWLIATAIAGQFVVGYLLDADGGGRGRGRGRGEGSGHGRGRGGEIDDDRLLTIHVVLGVTILVLATTRLAWRWATPLPPWAPTLTERERVVVHWTERLLYVAMFAMPLTGLTLVLGDDDLLGLHVAAHVTFFVAIAVHLGLAVKHQFVTRDRYVRRMT